MKLHSLGKDKGLTLNNFLDRLDSQYLSAKNPAEQESEWKNNYSVRKQKSYGKMSPMWWFH